MHSDGDPDERPTFLPPEYPPPAGAGPGSGPGMDGRPGMGGPSGTGGGPSGTGGRASGTAGDGYGLPPRPGDVPPLPGELPGHGGPGGSGGPGRDRSLLLLAGIVTSTLLVLATLVWWVASGRGPSIALGGEDPTPTPAETGVSPPPEPSESPTVPPIKPKVKGWQPVVQAERGLAYDVPDGWDVNSPGVIIGFENKNGPIVAMRGSADYKRGFCPGESGSSLGGAGVAAYQQGTPAQKARSAAWEWASAGYTDEDRGVVPRVSVAEPERVRIKGATAYHAVAEVSVDSPGKCAGPRALVHVVAVDGGGTKGAFVLYADQGISGALPEKTIDRIVGSVRLYRP